MVRAHASLVGQGGIAVERCAVSRMEMYHLDARPRPEDCPNEIHWLRRLPLLHTTSNTSFADAHAITLAMPVEADGRCICSSSQAHEAKKVWEKSERACQRVSVREAGHAIHPEHVLLSLVASPDVKPHRGFWIPCQGLELVIDPRLHPLLWLPQLQRPSSCRSGHKIFPPM